MACNCVGVRITTDDNLPFAVSEPGTRMNFEECLSSIRRTDLKSSGAIRTGFYWALVTTVRRGRVNYVLPANADSQTERRELSSAQTVNTENRTPASIRIVATAPYGLSADQGQLRTVVGEC